MNSCMWVESYASWLKINVTSEISVIFRCNCWVFSRSVASLSLTASIVSLWIFAFFIQAILPHPAAYFFATGGGYDKLEVYKCSDGVKTPAVTREMLIRFPNRMLSWRHQRIHMVIQLLCLNSHTYTHAHAQHTHTHTRRCMLSLSLV